MYKKNLPVDHKDAMLETEIDLMKAIIRFLYV